MCGPVVFYLGKNCGGRGGYKNYHKTPVRVEGEVLQTSNLSDCDMNTVYIHQGTPRNGELPSVTGFPQDR